MPRNSQKPEGNHYIRAIAITCEKNNGVERKVSVYFQDSHRNLYCGDCRDMAELDDESVQCVVTSPPYWGLRIYSGNPDLVWGDAWKGQLGLEPIPEMYVEHIVEIMREVWRVLRPDGVVFLNIGDSYWGGGYGAKENRNDKQSTNKGTVNDVLEKYHIEQRKIKHPIIKRKDLCLIPFRLAIALQEAGWWVRSDVVWNVTNSMPEGALDRPAHSHEFILILTKSRKYYWNHDAVREPIAQSTIQRDEYPHSGGGPYSVNREREAGEQFSTLKGRHIRSVWSFPTRGFDLDMCSVCKTVYNRKQYGRLQTVGYGHKCCNDVPEWTMVLDDNDNLLMECDLCGKEYSLDEFDNLPKASRKVCVCGASEWVSHFAAFPERLPELCIKAATKEGDVVLDPFAGTGTTLRVAAKYNRQAVGYEISEDYCRLIVEKNKQGVLL